MRGYWAVFRMRFISSAQHRIVAFSRVFTCSLWGFLSVLAYSAFYRANPEAFPMTLSQTVSYMWLREAFAVSFSVVYTADREIESALESGSIAYELVRPFDLYTQWFSRMCAGRISPTMLLSVFTVAFLFPAPYGLSLPPDISQLLLFLPSVILAFGVTVSFSALMYISMFYTTSYGGIKVMLIAVTEVFTGAVVPLPFYPAPVRALLEKLPFAAMHNMPLRIYTGNIAGRDALQGILFQIFWLTLLIATGKYLMGRALRKVIVQGG